MSDDTILRFGGGLSKHGSKWWFDVVCSIMYWYSKNQKKTIIGTMWLFSSQFDFLFPLVMSRLFFHSNTLTFYSSDVKPGECYFSFCFCIIWYISSCGLNSPTFKRLPFKGSPLGAAMQPRGHCGMDSVFGCLEAIYTLIYWWTTLGVYTRR